MKTLSCLFKDKRAAVIVIVIFAVYMASSFDVCNYPSQPEPSDKGYIFSSNWVEHLHTSECYAVYYETGAFAQGRNWISQGGPPDLSRDFVVVGDKYFTIAEPVTAALLVPFYTGGNLLLGSQYLIRSVMVGMMFFTVVSALLVRKICLNLNQGKTLATVATFIFAFATMAFTYAKLLYPQPVSAMLMLAAIVFLLNYKSSRKLMPLFFFGFFYALMVFSFNASIITAPFFLYYLFKIGLPLTKKSLYALMLGVLPIVILFFAWNLSTTGNLFTTPRQIEHQSMTFEILFSAPTGTWLNLEGIIGSLFSPVGIFFVSPILLVAFLAAKEFKNNYRNEVFMFASVIIVFWLFMSWANLGGSIQRDFWVGGWASIARYMYIPSTLLVIFLGFAFTKIKRSINNLIAAGLISLAITVSFLANLSYSIRHDLMVGFIQDVKSSSLLIWPTPIGTMDMQFLVIGLILASLAYPAYLLLNKNVAPHTD